ncbi:MAG: hypothetical protein R2706_08230 [Acidimicrobiales bacterium]
MTDYFDGELNAYDLSAFESHIASVATGAGSVDQIKMTVTLTRASNAARRSSCRAT